MSLIEPVAPDPCEDDESRDSVERDGSLRVPFGRYLVDGRMYAPLDVPIGKACGCVCPACGTALVAKHAPSGRTVPHFAHGSGADCAGGYESALHLAAKQLILEERCLFFPALVAEVRELDVRGNVHVRSQALATAGPRDLRTVQLEVWQAGFRPDLVVGAVDHADPVFVEIAVRHFVDAAKMARVTAANTPVLEFDLSSIREASWDSIRNALTTPNAVATSSTDSAATRRPRCDGRYCTLFVVPAALGRGPATMIARQQRCIVTRCQPQLQNYDQPDTPIAPQNRRPRWRAVPRREKQVGHPTSRSGHRVRNQLFRD